MKNRFLALLLVTLMAFSMVSCGNKDDSTETETAETGKQENVEPIEYDVDQYVSLGEYKGVEVTLDGQYEFTEEGFEEYVNQTISDAGVYVEDKDQTEIKEDSVVNVDYVGSQDGVAFDGGAAEDQFISMDGAGYIDGFTDGLPGHSVGEEVAYEVTFPDPYQNNTDLSGKTVIFTFQINYIAKLVETKADLTDDIVSEKFGYETVDEYLSALEESYKTKLKNEYTTDSQDAVLNAILNNSTVSEVPEELVQARLDMYLQVFEMQYQQYGTTAKDYIESMGQDYDAYVESMKTNISGSTETELVLEAVAKAEGIELDEKGYQTFIENIMSSSNDTDTEAFYKIYSVDGYDGERYFRQAYLTQKALDFCIDNAVINPQLSIED